MGLKYLSILLILFAVLRTSAQSLAERLGYSNTDKLLIVNVNDAGLCHSTNNATVSAMKNGIATSASIIIPSPWVYEAASFAKRQASLCFGIQLTLTNEWTKNYAWGSVASAEKVSSIISPKGIMYSELDDLYKNAVLSEVEMELRAQILKAYLLGIAPYFVNSHWGVLSYDDAYWNLVVKIASDYKLPIRFNSAKDFHGNDIAARKHVLDSLNILYPDHLIWDALDNLDAPQKVPARLDEIINNLEPGVTELFLTPADLTPELKTITHDYMFRAAQLNWLTDPETKQKLDKAGVKLISYKELWQLQQK